MNQKKIKLVLRTLFTLLILFSIETKPFNTVRMCNIFRFESIEMVHNLMTHIDVFLLLKHKMDNLPVIIEPVNLTYKEYVNVSSYRLPLIKKTACDCL